MFFFCFLFFFAKGNVQEIEQLLQSNENLDINVLSNDGVTPLIYASLNNHIEVVRLLLQKGARTDIQEENGWTALMHATIKRFVLEFSFFPLLYFHQFISLEIINDISTC